MIEMGDDIKEWLEVEPKERWVLLSNNGRCYDNIIINLLEIFNNVSKGVHGLFGMAKMRTTFYKFNKYFIERMTNFKTFLKYGVLWPLVILIKLFVDARISKRQFSSRFNLEIDLF